MNVLVIEDKAEIVEALRLAFQIRWPEARLISAELGAHGLELLENEGADIIILDLGLPDMSGYEVLKQIRLFSSVPVMILTVRGEESDVVKGLELGADDYMVKPFRQFELLSRVKALLRKRGATQVEEPVTCGPLSFNPLTGQLFEGSREIRLTLTEGRILYHLMRNAGQVVTHSSLAQAVWGDNYPEAADSLKVYIFRIREKIESDPGQPRLILTRAGIGYMMARPG